jgi:hypothetical protein
MFFRYIFNQWGSMISMHPSLVVTQRELKGGHGKSQNRHVQSFHDSLWSVPRIADQGGACELGAWLPEN